MNSAPHPRFPDSTLSLGLTGYEFISHNCRRLRSDAFATRLLGKRVVCMTGSEATGVFYDPAKFARASAAPNFVQDTLVGRGGVQGLDGEAHRVRKTMFMSNMKRSDIDDFLAELRTQWLAAATEWQYRKSVVLFDEWRDLLCRVACAWVGLQVPSILSERECAALARDCEKMIFGFASLGPRMWQGRRARKRAEALMMRVIRDAREGELREGSVLHNVLTHRDDSGQKLDDHTAAVELLNVIRPTVAIANYVTFAAVALADHPQWASRVAHDDHTLRAFAQEVRRYYPFTPFVGARVTSNFRWQGIEFEPGLLVLLDVYGINRDPRDWHSPDRFDPDRFKSGANHAAFIPQGGGGYLSGHRCAGEYLTTATLGIALETLTRRLSFDVPTQDLSYSLARMPTRPRSGFGMEGVRLIERAAVADDTTVQCPYSETVSDRPATLEPPPLVASSPSNNHGKRVRPGVA